MDFLLSTPLPPIAISLAVMFLLGVIFLRKKQNKRYPPVAGTVLHQLINRRKLNQYMTELACKHTTYRMLGLCRYTVYTADPVNVEYMLKTNVANYGMVYMLHIRLKRQKLPIYFNIIDQEAYVCTPFLCRDTCKKFCQEFMAMGSSLRKGTNGGV